MTKEGGGIRNNSKKTRELQPDLMELIEVEKSATTRPVDPSKLSREELLKAYYALAEGTRKLRELFAKSREITDVQRGMAKDAEESARTDPLTGLGNRRALDDWLCQEIVGALTNHTPFSVVMIDVDHFKRINDSYGHHIGDKTLRRIAEVIENTKRVEDVAFRYGGEEYLVILPRTDRNGALEFAKRLKHNIAKTKFIFEGVNVRTFTVSIGISEYPGKHSTLETRALGRDKDDYLRGVRDTLIKTADAAIYEAKNDGRNAIRIAPTEHSKRVMEIAGKIADEMGLSGKDATEVRKAARYHDIGKMRVPYNIVNKDSRFTPAELELMKQHSHNGAEIAREIGLSESVSRLIESHHERFDGKGYPNHLKGKHIPLGARIISVVDAFEAMISDSRGYATPVTVEQALDELRKNSGKQFDPQVVEAFLRLAERGEI